MHEGERIRRDVPLAGCHLRRPEQITRFGRAPGSPEDVSRDRYRLAVLSRESGGGRQGLQGQIVITQLLERLAAHLMSYPELLVERNGTVGVLQGGFTCRVER